MPSQHALFVEALDLSPEEREAFLDAACGGDTALRDAVLELLANDEAVLDPVLERLQPLRDAMFAGEAEGGQVHAGQVLSGQPFAGYHVLRELGHGGMGTVFLAERRDGEFVQRVAIKLIRGIPTSETMERFLRERRLLLRLRHPNIARLLDAGSTPEGQPYLVMEYVEGVSLSDWMREQQPQLASRLALLEALCQAVAHAHRNLIIHRDLKPGNILVRPGGDPVLLDFGIAKLLDDTDETGAPQTVTQMFTPAYASPEQLSGQRATTSSDIYALGLLMHEVLAGQPARQGSPRPGSRTVPISPSRAAALAEHPWVREAAPRIRGELDWVVQKALCIEPERRYATAEALAADIRRYRLGEPLEAGPAHLSYRLRKLVAANPWASAAAGTVLALILGFSWQLRVERDRALKAEAAAHEQAETAEEVTRVLTDMLAAAEPKQSRGKALDVRDMLARGRASMEKKLSDQPKVQGRVLGALGSVYQGIGDPVLSAQVNAEAIEAFKKAGNPDPAVLAQLLTKMAGAQNDLRKHDLALESARQGLALRRQHAPNDKLGLGNSHNEVGIAQQGLNKLDEAEASYREGLRLFRAAVPPLQEGVARSLHNLGYLSQTRAKLQESEQFLKEAFAIKKQLYGEPHPSTLVTMELLAQLAAERKDLPEALKQREVLHKLTIAVHGADSLHVSRSFSEMGSVKQDLGMFRAAEADYRSTLAMDERLGISPTLGGAVPMNNLATLLEQRGDFPEALHFARRSLAVRTANAGPKHATVGRAHHNLARILFVSGDYAQGLNEVEKALAIREAVFKEGHAEILDTRALKAVLLAAKNRNAAAIDNARAAVNRDIEARRTQAPTVMRLERWLADLEPNPAVREEKLRGLRKRALETLGARHPISAELAVDLAEALHRTGHAADARALLAEAEPILQVELAPSAPTLVKCKRLKKLLEAPGNRA